MRPYEAVTSIYEEYGKQAEKTDDEKAVEEFLTTLTSTSKYYKSMRPGTYSSAETVLENHLTPEQIKILAGENYLNVPELSSRSEDTTLPNIQIYKSAEGTHNLTLFNSGGKYRKSENPFINNLTEQFKQRNAAVESRDNLISKEYRKVSESWYELSKQSPEVYSLIESIEHETIRSLFLATLWNATKSGRQLDIKKLEAIARNAVNLQEKEHSYSSSDRTVGCEVEIPYTGSFTKKKVTSARYVYFAEHLDLLNYMGIPTEDDKQGEASLLPSYNPEVQYQILDQLRIMGFVPENAYMRYTMHVNVSLEKDEFEALCINIERDRMLQRVEEGISVLGFVAGCKYSSYERLSTGAYSQPLEIKEINKGGELEKYRLEFRALEYNPDESQESFVNKIETIKTIVDEFLLYAQAEDPESTRYGRFIRNLGIEVLESDSTTPLETIEKKLYLHIRTLVKDPLNKAKITKQFDSMIQEIGQK